MPTMTSATQSIAPTNGSSAPAAGGAAAAAPVGDGFALLLAMFGPGAGSPATTTPQQLVGANMPGASTESRASATAVFGTVPRADAETVAAEIDGRNPDREPIFASFVEPTVPPVVATALPRTDVGSFQKNQPSKVDDAFADTSSESGSEESAAAESAALAGEFNIEIIPDLTAAPGTAAPLPSPATVGTSLLQAGAEPKPAVGAASVGSVEIGASSRQDMAYLSDPQKAHHAELTGAESFDLGAGGEGFDEFVQQRPLAAEALTTRRQENRTTATAAAASTPIVAAKTADATGVGFDTLLQSHAEIAPNVGDAQQPTPSQGAHSGSGAAQLEPAADTVADIDSFSIDGDFFEPGGLTTEDSGPLNRSANETSRSVSRPVVTSLAEFGQVIARSALDGARQITVQLDPADLGHVEVALEFGPEGRLTAGITVERPETLELLQRDSRAIERLLSEQGFDLDGRGLNFSLSRDGSSDQGHADAQNAQGNSPDRVREDPSSSQDLATPRSGTLMRGLLDLSV